MGQQSIRRELLARLTHCYETDCRQFLNVPEALMQECTTRAALAELRNDGYVEEEARGVVRLRPRGYLMYQQERASDHSGDE